MSCLIRLVSLLFLSVLLLGSGSAWADPTDPPAKGRQSSLPDSVRRVERQTGGEVLRAEPMQRDGREVYRLKVLTADGRVRVVQDDPAELDEAPAKRRQKDKRSSDTDSDPPQF